MPGINEIFARPDEIIFDGTADPITLNQHLEQRAKAYGVKVEKMPQAIPGLEQNQPATRSILG